MGIVAFYNIPFHRLFNEVSKYVGQIILGQCDSAADCTVEGKPYCRPETNTCVECETETHCESLYGTETDASKKKEVCVAGTCELCETADHCTALFPGDDDKKACLKNGCRQCAPESQDTDCEKEGYKTCINGYCKSADGKFPPSSTETAPDGTLISYRKPWTKNTFQSKVLAPLQVM